VDEMARIRDEVTAAEFEAAGIRGKAEMARGAVSVTYDRRRDAIVISMRSGAAAAIPRSLIPLVAEAEPRAAADVELTPMGTAIRFPSLDADFAIRGLIRICFGLNEANSIAGATKSLARAAASRANGRKGGRPSTKVRS
jgi:hypothetical protein